MPFRFLRSPRRTALLLAVVAVVAACGGDSTGPKSPNGDYALSSINGKALPYRLFADTNYTVDVTNSTLALRADGSFVLVLTSEERVESHLSTYVDSAGGSWRLDGAVLTFTTPDSTTQSASWTGTTIAIADSTTLPPVSYLYSRR